MRRLLALTIISCTLLACQSTQQPFERMTDQELYTYNSTVVPMNQVYCSTEKQTGSYIRKRVCMTVWQIVNGLPGTLNTASSSTTRVYSWN